MCDDNTEKQYQRWLERRRLRRRELGLLGITASATLLVGACSDDSDTPASPSGQSTADASATAEGSETTLASPDAATTSGTTDTTTSAADAGTSVQADASAQTDASSGATGSDAASSTEADTEFAATQSQTVQIQTPDGTADAYFVHPMSGTHPAVILWPDIAGLRGAFEQMGTRLAAAGYAVLVVNQYYRSAPAPVLDSFDEWRTSEGQSKLEPMIAELNFSTVTSDGGAFVDWLLTQTDVVQTDRKVGSHGYCMGGPFAFFTAASRPEQVGAIASFHGANLVTDGENSPHQLIATLQAAMLIAIAESDDENQPAAKTELQTAADNAGLAAEIEVYPTMHGWCVTDTPVYDEVEAERAWGRLVATYGEQL